MPRQLVQEGGTCWFYSILNCMLLSRLGRRILLKRLNSFYNKLSIEQKALFDNKYLCVKATPKNTGFVFLKFVSNFWKGRLYRGKAEKLIENVGIPDAEHKALFGSYANIERERMLKTLRIPYSVLYTDKPGKIPSKNSQMVIVCDSGRKLPSEIYSTSVKFPAGVQHIPLFLPGYPNFELDHAGISLRGFNHHGNPIGHAISCIRLPNGEYRIVEPNGNQDPCRWTDPAAVHLFAKSGWYKEAYNWEISSWGFNSIVYINNKNLPKFGEKMTPTNLGLNKNGHQILVGPRGGKYVQYALGKGARPDKKSIKATPKVEKVGENSKGRVIYQGKDGGRFVIVTKDGRRFKRYIKTTSPSKIETPKKKPVGTNSKGRSIYKGPSGGRYVIVTSKDGKRYKKYISQN